MNQVIVIPDSPDRLAATKHNKDPNNIVGRNDGSINKQSIPKKISTIYNGIKRLISSPTSCNESSVLTYFRKSKPSIENDSNDKGKALPNTEVQKLTQRVNGYGESEKGVLPLANLPEIVSSDGSSKSSKVENIPRNGPTFDSGKGVDVLNVYRRKKLVQNECVPPLNIEKSEKLGVKCENGSVMKEEASGSSTVPSDGGSSIVDIKDLVAEDKDSCRPEGKEISCEFSSEEANAGSSHLSQREPIHKDPAESSTDFAVDANGWRTTHNHWKQSDNKQHKNEIIESDLKNETDTIKHIVDSVKTSSGMGNLPNMNESGIDGQTESSTLRDRGKRTISCIEDSVGQPSTSPSKRQRRDMNLQKIKMIQRDHNSGIEIIDLDDSPRASSCVPDIPNADELSINRQTESSTSRTRGKRPISCIDDGQPSIPRSKRSKNLSRPRRTWNKNLSEPSTSNPVTEPNIQIHGNNEDLTVRAVQTEEDENGNNEDLTVRAVQMEEVENGNKEDLTVRAVQMEEDENGNKEDLTVRAVQMEEDENGNKEDLTVQAVQMEEDENGNKEYLTVRAVQTEEDENGNKEDLTVRAVQMEEDENGNKEDLTVRAVQMEEDENGNKEDLTVRAVQMEEDENGNKEDLTVRAVQMEEVENGNNEDLNVRAVQMEEDENYAQQLQQQLYIEELEREENERRRRNERVQVNREFNENDYEMLLALDEDIYRRGATHAQINSLPESMVLDENSLECLICLETPTIGEKIRHLPCLHKFHKACVDEWLSRNTSCPLCKNSVDFTR